MADPTDHLATGHIKLTPLRISILRLARSEGAISRSDVRKLVRGDNLRTAISQLKHLHGLGLLTPIRTCEFVMSDAGDRWLDNHDNIHGGAK